MADNPKYRPRQNPDKLGLLQAAIADRQVELQRFANILAQEAQKHTSKSRLLKTSLIVIGSITAAHGAFDKYFDQDERLIGIAFMFLGIATALIAGLEAAFKFETRAAELNALTARCHSTTRTTDALWYKDFAIQTNEALRIKGALTLVETQNSNLSQIQEKAAALGVNLTLAVTDLHTERTT